VTVVVDASVAVRWLFPVSDDLRADELPKSDAPLIAPDLVIAEIVNVAWKFVTFDGLSTSAAATITAAAEKGFDELVASTAIKDRALRIALELRHPAYDCFYLALAEQRECQVVTADERLISKCARTPFAKLIRPLISVRSTRRR
jgi:predicted nucleic acid-binding protein